MKKLRVFVSHFVIICTLVFTASCGFVADKPVENINVYKTDELQTCKIDIDKLGEIFKTNQEEQIKCLQENFIQFTKYVRSTHPGAITEVEMGMFVKKFFAGQSAEIINGLSLIFQLNMILLKDEADRISHSKISPLFELLTQVNQEAVILTNIIKLMGEEQNRSKFWDLRKQFINSTSRFAKAAVLAIDNCQGIDQKLNIREFLLNMGNKIGDHQVDEDAIDSLIFLKKALIGGDKNIITTEELKNIVTKLPKVLEVVFDVYYSSHENFVDAAEEARFYMMDMRTLYHSVEFNQPDFELFTSAQIVKIAARFFKDYDVTKFQSSLELLKQKFIGGKKDNVTLKDLSTTISMIHGFYERAYFNDITYDEPGNLALLSNKAAIVNFPFRPLIKGYEDFTPARAAELHAGFADVAKSFRYYRDSTGIGFYETDFARNRKGFNEVVIAKWLVYKLLVAYGHYNENKVVQLNVEDFSRFLEDAKPILQELKLWSPKFQTFARNAVLLADLFQEQSNGDQNISVNEATEYVGMLLTAVNVSEKAGKNLVTDCDPGVNKEEPVYELNCFNRNYFNVILNKLGYKKSLPRLYYYITKTSPAEAMDYLKGVEGFARDYNDPLIPINGRDTTLVFGAMLNIESTFIRFDKNSDNVIDYDELSLAFGTYKSSIIKLAQLDHGQEKYAKAIFLYMASKMEVPKTGSWMTDLKFAAFSKCVQSDWCRNKFLDKIEAKRLNIGKLLYYMANQPTSAPKI